MAGKFRKIATEEAFSIPEVAEGLREVARAPGESLDLQLVKGIYDRQPGYGELSPRPPGDGPGARSGSGTAGRAAEAGALTPEAPGDGSGAGEATVDGAGSPRRHLSLKSVQLIQETSEQSLSGAQARLVSRLRAATVAPTVSLFFMVRVGFVR